jgi:hypothetical protein
MLTGELPADKFVPPSKKVVIDVRLDEVVLRALEKKPELRYQQASALKTQVETIAADAGKPESKIIPRKIPLNLPNRRWTRIAAGLTPFNLPPRWWRIAAGFLFFASAGFFVQMISYAVKGHFNGALACFVTGFYGGSAGYAFIRTARAMQTHSLVEHAVTIVSECAEGDPRLVQALQTLRPLDQSQVTNLLVMHLASTNDMIRRAAIYILWKGGFTSIAPAVASLQKLLAHPENFTRGMAALALGQNQLADSRAALMAMAKNDNDDYARRCAEAALKASQPAVQSMPLSPGKNEQIRQQVGETIAQTNKTETAPQFSRTAIVGMIIPALFFVFMVANLGVPDQTRWLQVHPLTLLVISAIALFGMCILGCVAVSQIRRSAGMVYGLPLAFVETMLFLLLALDTLILSVCYLVAVAVHGEPDLSSQNRAILLASTIILSLITDVFIVRWAWRAVNKPLDGSQIPPREKRRDAFTAGTRLRSLGENALACAGLSGILGAVTFCFWPNPPVMLVLSIPVAALFGLFLGIRARKTWLGKGAIVAGGINLTLWLVIGIAVQFTNLRQPMNSGVAALGQHQQPQTDFPRSSWANAGYADPASALETYFWASSRNDGKTILASMSPDYQNEEQQAYGDVIQKLGISFEEFVSRFYASNVAGITGFRILKSEAMSVPEGWRPGTARLTDYQNLHPDAVSEDQVHLHLSIAGKPDEQVFVMKKIGNEWKVDDEPAHWDAPMARQLLQQHPELR